jgi:dihydrofolate synthase/folylpolyglutamate synthase
MVFMSMVDVEKDYQNNLDFLYSFVDYSLTRQLRYSPDKFNLTRMCLLLELMGNPHRQYPVVHVAGTKGKGSTSAMIANSLKEAGYKVGLYTSPHLHDYCERIQIDGQPITHAELGIEINKIRPLLEQVKEITTFEITTAIGFNYFFERSIDIAVVEVGLGGRLDATNLVDPLVTVITSLSFDHMNILGDTIENIASEKGGIIKTGRPVIVAPQRFLEAETVLEEIASERNSPIEFVSRKYELVPESHSMNSQTFSLTEKVLPYNSTRFTLPLLGFHQIENAATAYTTLKRLRDLSIKISEENIRDGLAKVSWACRFEKISAKPFFIVDSAHNTDSAEKLSRTIKEYLNKKRIILLFGASEDKDITGMFLHLLPVASEAIMTKSTHPRATEPAELERFAKDFSVSIYSTESVETAVDMAIAHSDENSVVIATGSIFIAAAVKEIVQKLENRIEK